jgi:hypothetical protein
VFSVIFTQNALERCVWDCLLGRNTAYFDTRVPAFRRVFLDPAICYIFLVFNLHYLPPFHFFHCCLSLSIFPFPLHCKYFFSFHCLQGGVATAPILVLQTLWSLFSARCDFPFYPADGDLRLLRIVSSRVPNRTFACNFEVTLTCVTPSVAAAPAGDSWQESKQCRCTSGNCAHINTAPSSFSKLVNCSCMNSVLPSCRNLVTACLRDSARFILRASYSCILHSVLWHVHRLFQSEFYTDGDLVLHLSVSSMFSFFEGHAVAAYVLFLVFPLLRSLLVCVLGVSYKNVIHPSSKLRILGSRFEVLTAVLRSKSSAKYLKWSVCRKLLCY